MILRLLPAVCLLAVSALAQTSQPQPPSSASASQTPPAHPATAAQVHEYLVTTHALETAVKAIDQYVNNLQANSLPYVPKAFWDDMHTSFSKVDFETAYVTAYQKLYSEEDMKQAILFYKSPAGQHMLSIQPAVNNTVSEIVHQQQQNISHEVLARHKDELEAAKAKYTAEHPTPGSGQPAPSLGPPPPSLNSPLPK